MDGLTYFVIFNTFNPEKQKIPEETSIFCASIMSNSRTDSDKDAGYR